MLYKIYSNKNITDAQLKEFCVTKNDSNTELDLSNNNKALKCSYKHDAIVQWYNKINER